MVSATKFFEITEGPSVLDLLFSLAREQPVQFTLTGKLFPPRGVQVVTITIDAVVRGLERVDTGLAYWGDVLIKPRCEEGLTENHPGDLFVALGLRDQQYLRGVYDSNQRKGSLYPAAG